VFRELIEVYDKEAYSLEQCFNVPVEDMSDMTSCTRNVCLYIAGGSSGCVYRLALITKKFSEWPVHDVVSGITVTDTHSVLVTCCDVFKLKEFTTHGQLLRQIELGQDIVDPLHTIQLPSGEFVVCHGDFHSAQRVCLLDSSGIILKSFGGPRGSDTQHLDSAERLAVDKNGFVFVADCRNCRVVLLSPALTYVCEVVSHEQLQCRPISVSLDVDRRRLYVAGNEFKEHDRCTIGRVVEISL